LRKTGKVREALLHHGNSQDPRTANDAASWRCPEDFAEMHVVAHMARSLACGMLLLREMVRDAVPCHLGDEAPGQMPKVIRLHFVRDAALTGWKSPATA